MVDTTLGKMSLLFDKILFGDWVPVDCSRKLLRAQLLQMLYSIRSERLLMEQSDYNLLFRWSVGRNMDEPVWDATAFTNNRDRLFEALGGESSRCGGVAANRASEADLG